MFSNLRVLLLIALLQGCSSTPPPPVLTPHEQFTVDTARAQGLKTQFNKQVSFEKIAAVDEYINDLALQISKMSPSFAHEKILVRAHRDEKPELKHFYSFPGIEISVPVSFLKKVNFENELAAVIALELAHVERRDLANQMDRMENHALFGSNSIFRYDQKTRIGAIVAGIHLLYNAGFDPRGMVSIFQKHSSYYAPNTEAGKKEIEIYVKEAQKAKNEYLPSLKPIVRSNDFLRMKKGLRAHE